MPFAPSDERAHDPSGAADWTESWSFDFVDERGPFGPAGLGGFVRLTLDPAQRTASYWAYLVGTDIGLVMVRDHAAPMPQRLTDADITVRSDVLWAEVMCEAPFEHWGLGLEAFGLRLDDPRDELGERVAIGLDLEWEVVAPEFEYDDRYSQAGSVHGELLVGPDHFPFVGRGVRDHEWGARSTVGGARRQRGWCCVGDELALEVVTDADGPDGWVWRIGEDPVAVEDALMETRPGVSRWVVNHDVEIEWETAGETIVPLADPAATADPPTLHRCLATVTIAGTTGVGWLDSVTH